MDRIKTQEDFVRKASQIHGGYYDYSLVRYVRSSEKVKIICPVHGIFEQSPNKHLSGQGCKACGRNRTALGFDEFVRRAVEVHGLRYDYSKVEYHRMDEKVCIICREHGEFWQTPNCHIVLGQNCPKCARRIAGLKRSGPQSPLRRELTKRKSQETCLMKYGAKTYAESEEGRKRLHDIVTSDEVRKKMKTTCMERYGAKTWPESEVGRERLHQVMSSLPMQEKIRQGYMRNYGVDHYMKTEAGKAAVRAAILSPDHQLALQRGFLERYGVSNALASSEVQAKIMETWLDRYGVSHIGNSPEVQAKVQATNLARYGCKSPLGSSKVRFRIKRTNLERYGVECTWSLPEIYAKSWETKRRNGTFNVSKPEETMYRLLCDVFGKDDVDRQHFDEFRYPFHCDFYIGSLDLFIELNASWVHGGHWFNAEDPLDLEKLQSWVEHSTKRGSRYYRSAIHVWTESDPAKLQCAIGNSLNYVVFWKNGLSDFRLWFDSFISKL